MKRPFGILVLVFFLGTAAAVAFGVGMLLLFPGTGLDGIWEWNRETQAAFAHFGAGAGAALLLLSARCGAAVGGLRRGSRWA